MKKNLFFLVFIMGWGFIPAFSQSQEDQVKAVIISLFDGMRAKNPIPVEAAFAPQALMSTIVATGESTEVKSNPVADFVKRIAETPADTQLDERILDYQIQIDGDLASAWTPYRFYINENFSHCGVNSFQLVKMKEGWKIVYIIDTRRKEPCTE
jgi:hypothetical protein